MAMAGLNDFSQFSKLPLELREMIWRGALPGARVVRVEVQLLEPEEKFHDREELWYHEDRFGRDAEHEDTRSPSERNLSLRIHITSQGLDDVLRRQSQLFKYGFKSSRHTPDIAHVPFYDRTVHAGFGIYKPCPPPLRRDVRCLWHLYNHRQHQEQLHRYGFKTCRPLPRISSLAACAKDLYGAPYRYHCSTPFPAILHVCRESRQLAIASGYARVLPTPWAPPQTWFNLKTDFLHKPDNSFSNPGLQAKLCSGQLFPRLAVSVAYPEDIWKILRTIQEFQDLDELLVTVKESKSHPAECFIIDATDADVLDPSSAPADEFQATLRRQVRDYYRDDHGKPPYFESVTRNLHHQVTEKLRDHMRRGGAGVFKIPKIRCVHVLDAQGKQDLEAARARYRDAENLPTRTDWRTFLREDTDARNVALARHASHFDVRYADDIEVEREMYRQSIMEPDGSYEDYF